jgi:peptidoglycan/xylan/chitin deacetylase (PgdA/CDA1 family)
MKAMLFKVLRATGLPTLFRELIQKDKVSILLFHDISQATAEQTFTYLSDNYNIISLNDFIEAREKNDFSGIPRKALIITFDDGHIRNYDMLPVIKKFKIPITIFLCASLIDTNRHFWFKYKNDTISVQRLKHLTNTDRLNVLAEVGFKQDQDFDNPHAMNKKQIIEMKPYIDLQSHTMFHPCLPKCNNFEAREEIFKSKQVLTYEYGLNINAISYPNGDYSDRDISLSKEAGYKCGITVDFGFNTPDTDLFRLKRISVNDTADINELIVKASGFWSFIKTRNGSKQLFGYSKQREE